LSPWAVRPIGAPWSPLLPVPAIPSALICPPLVPLLPVEVLVCPEPPLVLTDPLPFTVELLVAALTVLLLLPGSATAGLSESTTGVTPATLFTSTELLLASELPLDVVVVLLPLPLPPVSP